MARRIPPTPTAQLSFRGDLAQYLRGPQDGHDVLI